MANPEHIAQLSAGVTEFNFWRKRNQDVLPDLSESDFNKANLARANLTKANLTRASLSGAVLTEADLSAANLTEANLSGAFLIKAKLTRADLNGANFGAADLILADLSFSFTNISRATLVEAKLIEASLYGADLTKADFTRANLGRADLRRANLSEGTLTEADLSQTLLLGTNLTKANLTGCWVYGLSAWDVQLEGAIQSNLVITPRDAPVVTVDNLNVAQFIYLLLSNQEIRHVIDTITSKVVLILGRFTPERKAILDAMRGELRNRGYTPVLFDFDKPSSRDITETVSTLAHMARFVIADITDAKSIPQELMAIVPDLPSVPVQPLLLASQREYGMFEHFKRYPWVLEPYLYDDQYGLLAAITEKVIGPAEAKAKEQTER